MRHERPYTSDTDDDAELTDGRKSDDRPRFRAPILPPNVRPDLHPGVPAEVPPPQREVWIPLKQTMLPETVVKHEDDDDEDEEQDDAPRTAKTTPSATPAVDATGKPVEQHPEAADEASQDTSAQSTQATTIPTQPTPPLHQPEAIPALEVQPGEASEEDDDSQAKQPASPTYATLPPLPPLETRDIQRQYMPPSAEQQAFTPPAEAVPSLQVPERPSVWQPEATSPFAVPAAEQSANQAFSGEEPPQPPTHGRNETADFPEYPDRSEPWTFYNGERQAAASAAERPTVVEARDRRVTAVGLLLAAEWYARRRQGRKLRKDMEALASRQHHEVLTGAAKGREQHEVLAAEQRRHTQEMQSLRHQQERTANALPLTYGSEQSAQRPAAPFEVPGQQLRAERQPLGPVVTAERQKVPAAEQADAEQSQPQYDVQPRQHVEQDAWRRYVVDEHGREVQGAITYGEAFHQERQQEIRRDRVSDDAAGLAASSVGGVIMHGQNVQHPTLPSGLTGPALPPGKPTHVDPQHQLPEHATDDSFSSNLTNPWFWIMLILIVAAFFTAALI